MMSDVIGVHSDCLLKSLEQTSSQPEFLIVACAVDHVCHIQVFVFFRSSNVPGLWYS